MGLRVQWLGLGDLAHIGWLSTGWSSDLVRNLPMPFNNVTLGQLVTSAGLGFLICHMKIIIHIYLRVILMLNYTNMCKLLGLVPGTWQLSNKGWTFDFLTAKWHTVLRSNPTLKPSHSQTRYYLGIPAPLLSLPTRTKDKTGFLTFLYSATQAIWHSILSL